MIKQCNSQSTLLGSAYRYEKRRFPIGGCLYRATNVSMYYFHLRTNYQLTFRPIFKRFVIPHVVQSKVHPVSAIFIPYHFRFNLDLISLMFSCADLRCHILLTSLAESDFFLVSFSHLFAVPIFRNTLADHVFNFLINKPFDSSCVRENLYYHFDIITYKFLVLFSWILCTHPTLSLIL